jgi:hypothetical protein
MKSQCVIRVGAIVLCAAGLTAAGATGCAAQPDGAESSVITEALGRGAGVLPLGTDEKPTGPRKIPLVATAKNILGSAVTFPDPCTTCLLLVTHVWNPGGVGGVLDPHPLGATSDGAGTGYVFHEDGTPIPVGDAFTVVVDSISLVSAPAAGAPAVPIDGAFDSAATWFITAEWPPGVNGVSDTHVPALSYLAKQWSIVDADGSPVPGGASFAAGSYAGVTVVATQANAGGTSMYLDAPSIGGLQVDGNPDAALLVSQNLAPSNGAVAVAAPVGVFYDTQAQKWGVFTEDGSPLPLGAAFNVAAF